MFSTGLILFIWMKTSYKHCVAVVKDHNAAGAAEWVSNTNCYSTYILASGSFSSLSVLLLVNSLTSTDIPSIKSL